MITLEELLKGNLPIIFHLTVTGRCNARCEGCLNSLMYGERARFAKTWEEAPEASIKALDWLIQSTNGDSIFVAFYGGEPLLVFERVRLIAERLRKTHNNKKLGFILYTNGMLLNEALLKDNKFFEELDFLIVSIDGTKEQHNKFRKGTDLEKIEKNLEYLKSQCHTKVIMWSTLREGMSLRDCVDEFFYLYQRGLVDFFFWHLIDTDEPLKDFETFRHNYLKDLIFLLERFIEAMEERKILPVLPLAELIYFLIKGIRRGQTGCGVEKLRNFDILAGKVLPCVDMGDGLVVVDFLNGKSADPDLSKLQNKLLEVISYKEWLGCEHCEAEFFCGGRCPVLIKKSPHRSIQYCILTRDLVSLTKDSLPQIEKTLKSSGFSEDALYYPYGYLNLLTDVVP